MKIEISAVLIKPCAERTAKCFLLTGTQRTPRPAKAVGSGEISFGLADCGMLGKADREGQRLFTTST